MTREELKKNIRSLFYSSKTVEKYLEKAYTLIDKIYDEHEVLLKEAYDKGYLSAVKDILNKKVTHGND